MEQCDPAAGGEYCVILHVIPSSTLHHNVLQFYKYNNNNNNNNKWSELAIKYHFDTSSCI